jgi:hypothetical protein
MITICWCVTKAKRSFGVALVVYHRAVDGTIQRNQSLSPRFPTSFPQVLAQARVAQVVYHDM